MESRISVIKLKERLEEEFKMDLALLKHRVSSCDVYLSEDSIKEYLNDRFKAERPLTYRRNEERRKRVYPTISILDKENDDYLGLSENESKDFSITKVYRFREEQLNNFKNVIKSYRRKSLILLSIISYYLNDKVMESTLLEMIDYLEIEFDGLTISSIDFDRLIKPTIYNIKKLFEITDKANNYITYFNNPELFEIPSSDIHVFDPEKSEEGFIPLTNNQKNRLVEIKNYTKKSS